MRPRLVAMVAGAAVLLAAWPVGTAAQARPVARLGILSSASASTLPGFRFLPEALRELGWVEGRNVVFEWRWAEGRADRLPELAAELVRSNVDVIVAVFNPEVAAAKRATSRIPIAMVAAIEPVGAGLVASLARPGGNVIGTTVQSPEFAGKMLELLREALPRGRPGVGHVGSEPSGRGGLRAGDGSRGEDAGVALQFTDVREPADVGPALSGISAWRADALLMAPTGLLFAHRTRILGFAVARRLPTIVASTVWARDGALMSYTFHLGDLYRRSAAHIDRILKGAKPADLPVEQPTRFELVVNLKTAKALGVTIPRPLVLRADEVIH